MDQRLPVQTLSPGFHFANGTCASAASSAQPQPYQDPPDSAPDPLVGADLGPFASGFLMDNPNDGPNKITNTLYNGPKPTTPILEPTIIGNTPDVPWAGLRNQSPFCAQQPLFGGLPAHENQIIYAPPATMSAAIPLRLRDGQVIHAIPVTSPAASWTQGAWLPHGTGYRSGTVGYIAMNAAVPRSTGGIAASTSVDAEETTRRRVAEDLELDEILSPPAEAEIADDALEESSAETRPMAPLSSVALWHMRNIRVCHLFHPTPALLKFLGTCAAPTRAECWRYRYKVDGQNRRDSKTYPKIHEALGNIGVLCFIVLFERRAVKAAKHLLGLESKSDAVAFKKRKDELVNELKRKIGHKTYADFCDDVSQLAEHHAHNFEEIYRRCQGLITPT